jgi:hypothetical protein
MTDETHQDNEGSTADRLHDEAVEACKHLDAMAKLCCDATGASREQQVLDALSFQWQVNGDPQTLADTMLDQALAAASEQSPIRRGYVFCYRCNESGCEHSAPTSSGDVFMGYRNNGEPVWQEFFSALNDLGDDRVDRVFDARPRPLARFVSRKWLIQEQLIGSGRNSMTYRILGQVVAGYFEIKGKRCALTLQAVEDPTRRLFLQLLAPHDVHEAMTEEVRNNQTLSRLYSAVGDLRHRLNDQQTEWRKATGRKERQRALSRIERQLQHQVNVIEKKGRQGARRTKHAHDRSDDKRPIHSAMQDLREANNSCFFLDRPRNSIVVVGKRGRTHVFNPEGKHVTTLQLAQERLDRRLQRNRYTPLMDDEI